MTDSKRSAKKSCKRRERPSPAEIKNIQDDLNAPTEPLKSFMEYYNGGKGWRGFDFDFLIAHGCRFISGWTHPKNRNTNKEERTPTDRMIIPAGDSGYLARLVDDVKNYDVKAQSYIRGKEKIHAGVKKLFGADVLDAPEPIFCFEGYIDAMSAELVGFKSVAIGGKGEGDLIVSAVDNLNPKPQIIILLDPDAEKEANQLRADLLSVKCPCVVRFLSKPTQKINYDDCDSGSAVIFTEKIDANSILQNQGADVLRIMLQDILDDSLAELNAVEAELMKKDDAGLSDDDWDFIFSGDSSDLDFARRLERFCGSAVRWLTDDEYWLTYDNGVWLRGSEKNSVVAPFARKLADAMKQNANDKDERDLADKFKSSKKIGAAITLLKSCDSILISADDLDKHPQLLNCLNGVVDLETGELMQSDNSLKYLTQQVSVSYDARADSTAIEKFFQDIQPDEMTRAGLKRWIGYNTTGNVREEKFLIWLGESGANGKGVLSRTLSALFRDYAAALPRNAFVLRKFDDGNSHTAALNSLVGARFSIAEELPQNVTLDSALIKTLVGGDMQTFRRLREEFKDFEPTAKINISSNFIPRFENVDDGGIERRLLVMPFEQIFKGESANPFLKEQLLMPDNLRGLLKILVDEAKAWYRNGLIISDKMKKATTENLDANDFISDFLAEHCEIGEGMGEVPRQCLLAELYEHYPRAYKFNETDLCKMIAKRGVKYKRMNRGYVFNGIHLLKDKKFDSNLTPPDDFSSYDEPIPPPDDLPF
ncbi:MAG: hypothetical protein IKZ53_03375 [Selenomonadaceae bacterium]|nr:hypothetical protein [Selenomonadaceae bacterium]